MIFFLFSGLDIDHVSLVINYDMPVTVTFEPDYETYLHRIELCGHFGKLGTYTSLFSYSNIKFFFFFFRLCI